MKRTALAWAVTVAISVVCTAAPATAESIRGAIEKGNAAWISAFGRGDAAAVAALYTPTATLLPPGGPITKGRADIQAFWQGAFAALHSPQPKTLNVTSYGDSAREIGAVSGDMGGKPFVGKYVVIWKKLRGRWLLDTDVWNADQ